MKWLLSLMIAVMPVSMAACSGRQPQPVRQPSVVRPQPAAPRPAYDPWTSETTTEGVKNATTRDFNRFTNALSFSSPLHHNRTGPSGLYGHSLSLSFVVKADNPMVVVFVNSSHGDRWHHYNSALAVGGVRIPIRRGNTDVSCRRRYCTYSESVFLVFQLEDMVRMRTSGLEAQISGPGGSFIVSVPAFHIDGFLKAIEEYAASQQP